MAAIFIYNGMTERRGDYCGASFKMSSVAASKAQVSHMMALPLFRKNMTEWGNNNCSDLFFVEMMAIYFRSDDDLVLCRLFFS